VSTLRPAVSTLRLPGKRTCLFCGAAGPLTKEHVYPLWLYRAIGLVGPVTTVYDRAGVETDRRTSRNFDTTLREVCATCNHGWLHDLERSFRAVLLPAIANSGPVVLSSDSQRVVALWAVKTWLLAELAHERSRHGGVRAPGALRVLRERNAPPAWTQVWLGAVRSRNEFATWLSTLNVVDASGAKLGVFGLLTIGAAVFAIYGPHTVNERVQRMVIRTQALSQIWPNKVEEVRWPTTTVLSAADIERLWPSGGTIVLPE